MSITQRDIKFAAKAADEVRRYERNLDAVGALAADMSEQYTAALEAVNVSGDVPRMVEQMNGVAAALGIDRQAADRVRGLTASSDYFEGLVESQKKFAEAFGNSAMKKAIDNIARAFGPPISNERIAAAFGPSADLVSAIDSVGALAVGSDLAATIDRLRSRTVPVGWSDVLDARAGFVSTLDDLDSGDAKADNEVITTEVPSALPEQEPWTRGEKIALAGVIIGATSMLLMFLATQDSIVRNARYDAHLIQRAVDHLIDYVATLVVWYSELPKV